MLAACRSHVDFVRLLLGAGADANARDKLGRTPLMGTSHGMRVPDVLSQPLMEIVRALVQGGANVNAVDSDGVSALAHLLEYRRHADVVRYLLDCGASATVRDKLGRTPLAMHGHLDAGREDIVRMLLDSGADPDTTLASIADDGEPIVFRAVYLGNDDVVELLIDRGVDPLREHRGANLVDWAAACGRLPILEMLARDLPADSREVVLSGALMHASQCGRLDSVRLLVRFGANVSCRSRDGLTALRLAFLSRSAELLTFLLDSGADASQDGPVLLKTAIDQHHDELARVLVRSGVPVDRLKPEDSEALFRVTKRSDWDARIPRNEPATVTEPRSVYVRFVQGGLPGLGKRR